MSSSATSWMRCNGLLWLGTHSELVSVTTALPLG